MKLGRECGHETHVPIVFCHMLYKYVWFVHRLWYVSDGDGCAIGKTESKLNKFPRSERRCKKLCGLLIRSELYGHVYINLATVCVPNLQHLGMDSPIMIIVIALRGQTGKERQWKREKTCLLFSQFRPHHHRHHHHPFLIPPSPQYQWTTDTLLR